MQEPLVSPPRKLFALLRHLDIDQQRLANHLGLSHTLISLWAHGKKPIPDKHRASIHAFVHDTFRTRSQDLLQQAEGAVAVYLAEAEQAGETSTAAMHTARAAAQAALHVCRAALATFDSLWEELLTEWVLLDGILHRVLYEACRRLGEVGRRQPHHLAADEREEMRTDCLFIQDALRRLGHLEHAVPARDPQLEHQHQELERRFRAVG